MQHAVFRAFCSKKWATELRNKLKEFLEFNLPKNTSPQLFHWYANYKKKEIGGSLDKTSADTEEMQEKLNLLQRNYVMMEKKEEYAKTTLIDS